MLNKGKYDRPVALRSSPAGFEERPAALMLIPNGKRRFIKTSTSRTIQAKRSSNREQEQLEVVLKSCWKQDDLLSV
jgi:hypothetical protein